MIDLSQGFPVARELTLVESPGAFRFAENFMLAFHDPASDISMWLHLGTCPDDFGLWEDMVLLSLPGEEGVMWMTAYARTPEEQRPAGASLAFRCLEPWKRWQINFDGMMVQCSNEEMLSGRVRDGFKQRVTFEFDTESVAPVWDNHQSADHGSSAKRGSMAEQSWASEHYQQLFALRGELMIGERRFTINTTGVRDHSRGQRGHAQTQWGGHNLWTAAFPSGKAFGMQRMWSPEGKLTLNVGFVYINGEFHHVDVISDPALLTEHQSGGESLELILRSPLGDHRITGEVLNAFFVNLESPYGMSIGYDPNAGFGTFAPGFSRWQWGGETAYGLTERSGK